MQIAGLLKPSENCTVGMYPDRISLYQYYYIITGAYSEAEAKVVWAER